VRLRRITLRHYRGVDDRTVDFDGNGVTVVAGPNEVGKSSLAESLDLLFEHLDSSKRKDVLAVKPVHRDEGAEIEAEVEAGAYRFTYFKRFHKKPETRLTVTAPAHEQLSGREAHERVQAILGESVDMALWRALRIDQGTALGLPSLGDNASLSKALDAAAGAARSDDDALTLFDRARAEFDRYFTTTGREKKELAELTAAVEAQEQERGRVAEALRQLERDAERSRAVEGAIRARQAQLVEDERAAEEADTAWRALERRVSEVEKVEAERETAVAHAAGAARDRAAREALVAAVTERAAALAQAQAEAAESDPSADAAAKTLALAAEALDAARAAAAAADRVHAVREDDLAFRRAELDHAQLSERLGRIEAAEGAARAAEETLAASRVDAAAIAAVREAERAAREARIRAEAGSAQVAVDAATDVRVTTGGEETSVGAGESAEHSALDEIVVDAPGVVRVTVRPAGDASELRAAVSAADDRLAALLARCGVPTTAAAEEAHAAHADAERAVERRQEIVAQDLRDLSRDDIERKVRNLAPRVETYLAERESVPGAEEVAATFDDAQDAVAEARRGRDAAATALEDARRTHDGARTEVERQKLAAESVRTRVEMAQRDAERASQDLAAARETESDEALAARHTNAEQDAAAAQQRAQDARAEVDAAQPEKVRLAADGAAAAVQGTRAGLRAAQDEALELRTRLKQAGQEGLAERLDALDTALHHVRRERDATRRRAAAAGLLFRTLSAKRDAARQAYVAPLRERIVRLGKIVFGASFDVELDEDLTITQRTLDGRTVPFDGLSGGAQEQLDILMRAAAAMVVSESGGVPLILDDALGYSDPERLAALGAVLSLAGEQCQVIVLTCVPDRYRHVANAHVVRLA
jgi:DNA repair exonuclease SbcCD ATPase subunit